MSRTPLGGIIAVMILVFTAVAYYVTTSKLTDRFRTRVEARVNGAQLQLKNSAVLKGLTIQKQVEVLANDGDFALALAAETDKKKRVLVNEAFQHFMEARGQNEDKPNLMWLLDAKGDVAAQHEIRNPIASEFKQDGKFIFPAVELALSEDRAIISEVWRHDKHGLLRVGIAPVINLETDKVAGAIVIAYPLTARQAQVQNSILGAQVAYFHGDSIFATSFTRNAGEEDTEMQAKLAGTLKIKQVAEKALKGEATPMIETSVDGSDYLATALRLPRFTSDRWPPGYPDHATGAVVMMSLSEAMSPVDVASWALILLGVAAFILALLASAVTARRILHQADEIEDGINDIIDGNLERSIRPVGADLDGLAHAVNVMLARLLGRPEPGDEEYDEYGNLVSASRVDFDNEELAALSPADERSMKLAQESEPEYYSRVFREYLDARERMGESNDSVTYENFVAKLRLNEAKLKVKYQCSAVRFRVDVKDGKVSLKPVPIV